LVHLILDAVRFKFCSGHFTVFFLVSKEYVVTNPMWPPPSCSWRFKNIQNRPYQAMICCAVSSMTTLFGIFTGCRHVCFTRRIFTGFASPTPILRIRKIQSNEWMNHRKAVGFSRIKKNRYCMHRMSFHWIDPSIKNQSILSSPCDLTSQKSKGERKTGRYFFILTKLKLTGKKSIYLKRN
jgi:hypothetical protein